MIYSQRLGLWLAIAFIFASAGTALAQQYMDETGNFDTRQFSAPPQVTPAKKVTAVKKARATKSPCKNPSSCIGMVIDSGDPVLVQMGHEMSKLVSDKKTGTVVQPTRGPIANVRKLLSKENAGLSVVPSDMLLYTARSGDPQLQKAASRLRFIMTIGRKVVHVVARTDIKSLQDLDGKRVVMGPDNTALWVVSNNLLHLHGATPSKKIQLKPPAGLSAVLAGNAEAVFIIGNPPIKLVQKLSELSSSDGTKKVHLLELRLPVNGTEYQPATVNYPGFAENHDTVAILPTLVSYDFTHKVSPYFNRRCGELAKIGQTVRGRLEQLRASGHKQWRATTWELEAGSWKKDGCFFRAAEEQVASSSDQKVKPSLPWNETQSASRSAPKKNREDVREAQKILSQLGYKVGTADGIQGPNTTAALKKFQKDQGMQPNGVLDKGVLSILRIREKLSMLDNATHGTG